MKTAPFLVLLFALAIGIASLSACAGLTTHQQIAVACSDVAAAAEAIAVATDAGKVSKADAKKAAAIYHATDAFCEPPVDSLSEVDLAKLAAAATSLAAIAGGAK